MASLRPARRRQTNGRYHSKTERGAVMKAMVVREHGGLEKLRLELDFPDPKPGEGDVVVRVRASSLNYHDVFTRRGMPGIKLQMPLIMGLDVAGEILELGP